MKKVLLLILCTLTLTACDGNSDEERAAIKARLPAGCSIQYLGNFSGVRTVLVLCDGKKTATTSTYRSSGKTHYDEAAVAIFEE